jgi:hypothetical protein
LLVSSAFEKNVCVLSPVTTTSSRASNAGVAGGSVRTLIAALLCPLRLSVAV